jgi:hypothetical protein
MDQGYLAKRCERCSRLMTLVPPADGKGPWSLRCANCHDVDPLNVPAIAGWIDGELLPPK